jgi:excinuclease ABC subunit C
MASILDKVPGIGPTRRKWLLSHFGSLQAIREATIEELTAAPGITAEIAQKLKEHLD